MRYFILLFSLISSASFATSLQKNKPYYQEADQVYLPEWSPSHDKMWEYTDLFYQHIISFSKSKLLLETNNLIPGIVLYKMANIDVILEVAKALFTYHRPDSKYQPFSDLIGAQRFTDFLIEEIRKHDLETYKGFFPNPGQNNWTGYDSAFDHSRIISGLGKMAVREYKELIEKKNISKFSDARLARMCLELAYIWSATKQSVIRQIGTEYFAKPALPYIGSRLARPDFSQSDLLGYWSKFTELNPQYSEWSIVVSRLVEDLAELHKTDTFATESRIRSHGFHELLDMDMKVNLDKTRSDAEIIKSPDLPFAVIFIPKTAEACGDIPVSFDGKGWVFFSYESRFMERINKLAVNHNVIVKLVSSVDEINEFFRTYEYDENANLIDLSDSESSESENQVDLKKEQLFSYVEFQAHGNSKGFFFGPTICQAIDDKTHTTDDTSVRESAAMCGADGITLESYGRLRFHNRIAKGAQFFLNSCETGKGEVNISQALSSHQELKSKSVTVMGPTIKIREKYLRGSWRDAPSPDEMTVYSNGKVAKRTPVLQITSKNIKNLDFMDTLKLAAFFASISKEYRGVSGQFVTLRDWKGHTKSSPKIFKFGSKEVASREEIFIANFDKFLEKMKIKLNYKLMINESTSCLNMESCIIL